MPPLPRGTCTVCGGDVALRNGGLVREHRDPKLVERKRQGAVGYIPVCEGSGKKAVTS